MVNDILLAPVISLPFVNVNIPVTDLLAFSVTPFVLSILKLAALPVAGNSILVVVCAALPLYSRIAEAP